MSPNGPLKRNLLFSTLAQSNGPYSPEQLTALADSLVSPERLSSAQLAEVEQIARKLASNPIPELPQINTDASSWFRAMQSEAAGNHAEAARLLEGSWDSSTGDDRALRCLAQVRNRIKEANPNPSDLESMARRLADAAKHATSARTLASADRLLRSLRSKGELPARRRCRIALLGSVTMEFWVPSLRVQCFGAGIDAEFHVGSFGQYQQEILDPNSGTAAFKPDIVILAPHWGELGLQAGSESSVERAVQALRELWGQVRTRMGAFVIQLNAEIPLQDPYGRLSAVLPDGNGRMLRRLNLQLWDAERAESGVAILDVEQVSAAAGKRTWADPVLWFAAKQHPSPAATPVLTQSLTALCRAILGLSAKCVAVDLDGVMWGGVIGEDGLAGIQVGGGPVGEAHAAFQQYLKGLSARGILLAACSKNNLEDALAPFREHRGMVLKEEDFAVFVANWETKDHNLRDIAKRLNIGLDAIVFVDDNPMERAIVRQNIPEIEVVELPKDPSGYIAALDEPHYFEALTLTQEDLVRGQSIRQNQERNALATQAGNVDDYLAGLQMAVELAPFQETDLARIVQLINKTNQFNLTTRRLNDAEVRALMARPGTYTQSLRVADRFGDSGLTGVLIALREGDELRIHTWLMSCRVMGRRLEEVVFAALSRHAAASGAVRIVGEYIPTAKNEVVAPLYPRLGLKRNESQPGEYWWSTEAECSPPAFVKLADLTNQEATLVN